MAVQRVDAFRVAFDLEYAAGLNDSEWAAVLASPEWHILSAENADLLAPVVARFPDKLSVSAQGRAHRQRAARPISVQRRGVRGRRADRGGRGFVRAHRRRGHPPDYRGL